MQFPLVKNSEGLDVTVSEGNYLLNMTSNDRLLRRNSFKVAVIFQRQERQTEKIKNSVVAKEET